MWLFRTGSDRQISAAVTLTRVFAGGAFIAHGAQKVFGFGMKGVVSGFTQFGVPQPGLTGPMISFLELGGGILLALGLLTRVAAFLLACDMAGAIAFVHGKAGFFLPMGYEFALTLLVLMVALLLIGGGPHSLDALLSRPKVASREVEPARPSSTPVLSPRRRNEPHKRMPWRRHRSPSSPGSPLS